MLKSGLLGVFAAVCLAGGAFAASPHITDGGFEDVQVPLDSALNVSGQNVGGWQGSTTPTIKQSIVNGELDVGAGQPVGRTPFGVQYMLLGHGAGNSFYSKESQVISDLTPGTTYQISLYFAGAYGALTPNIFGVPPRLDLQVFDGAGLDGDIVSESSFLLTSIAPFGRSIVFPMEEATIQFQASSDTATFRMANHSNAAMMAIDNVSLTQVAAAPEPSTWALMLVGVGLAGGALRARRRVAAAAA